MRIIRPIIIGIGLIVGAYLAGTGAAIIAATPSPTTVYIGTAVTLERPTSTVPPCTVLAPSSEDDPEAAAFIPWAESFGTAPDGSIDLDYNGDGSWTHQGHIVGYAAAEDATVFNRPECVATAQREDIAR